jgi:uncharacterized membrane protein YedE/YeeE
MDLVPLIDSLGENGAALAGGAVLGLVFGFFAQRTAFCTRTAVLDVARGRGVTSLATWMAGFAAAVLGVQILLAQGMLDVTETRFFATPQSLSGALVGGALFGLGMVLARGCVSRLLVLGASGNLRAVFTLAILAVFALATYDGFLVPVRDAIGGLASTADVGGNDLVVLSGIGTSGGLAIGIVLALAALGLAFAAKLPPMRFVGGAAVGATIVGGWYFTWQLSQQVFEPIQAESLSYVRPLATTAALGIGSDGAAGLDQGVLIGIIAGAFVAALASRQFRIATFSEPGTPSVLRYAAGAALMGFGGILAVGCTIGAGFTGGAVLALSSLLGLASMMASAALADRLIDAPRAARAAAAEAPVAAE